MASDNYGVSFSPISGDQTEEELQRMLERLFGGAKPSISALPRPKIRGVIDNLFASLLSGGVRRPEISEILAPQQPAVTEAPEGLPEEAPAPAEELAPERMTPEEGEPVAPGTEQPEGPEVDWPVPNEGQTDPYGNPYLGSPGNVPSTSGPTGEPNPINPFSEYAPTAAPSAPPVPAGEDEEDDEFFRTLLGQNQPI